MAERLTIEGAFDPAGISEGLRRAVSLASAAAAKMQAGFAAFRLKPEALAPPNIVPQFAKIATNAGSAFVEGLQKTFRSEMSDAREELFRGLIDKSEFDRRGAQAAKAFNDGLLNGMAQLGDAGRLTQKLSNDLTAQLKAAGLKAGQSAGAAIAAGLRAQREQIANSVREAGRGMETAGRELTVAVTAPIAGAAFAATKFANEFEVALAGVRKTTNASEADVASFGKQLRALATQPGQPGAAQLAGIAQISAQLGVTQADLLEFTKTISALDLSTNLGAEEGAAQLAKFANTTGTALSEIGKIGSAVVALGNTTATTEKDIVNMALKISGAGTSAGLTAQDILGLAAGLSSLGLRADAGGTAISRVISDVSKAVGTGGPMLEKFAGIAGRTGAELQAAFKADPSQEINRIIQGLGKLQASGTNLFSIFDELEFDDRRVTDALSRAVNAGDKLNVAVATANREFSLGTALQREFAIFAGTTTEQMKALTKSVTDVLIELGEGLRPVIKDVVVILQSFVPVVKEAAEGFANLPAGMKTAIVAIAGIAAVAGPVLFVLGNLAQSVIALRLVTGGLAGAQGIGALNAAMRGIAPVATAAASGTAAVATGAAGLGAALTIGAPVIVGLGLLALYYRESTRDAREAKAAADAFSASLDGQGRAVLLQRRMTQKNVQLNTAAEINRLRDELETGPRFGQARGNAGAAENLTLRDLKAAEKNLARINIDLRSLDDAIGALPPIVPEVVPPKIPEIVNPRITFTSDTEAAQAELDAFLKSVSEAGQRLSLARDLKLGPAAEAAALEDVEKAQARLNARIAEQAKTRKPDVELLEALLRLTNQIGAVDLPVISRLQGPPPKVALANVGLAATNERAREVARSTSAAVTQSEKLARSLGKIGTGARGIFNVVSGLGKLNEQLRKTADGALGALDGLEEMARVRGEQAAAQLENPFEIPSQFSKLLAFLPGAVGVVGGLVGVIGGLLGGGPSPLQQAIDANRVALDRLRLGIDKRTDTLRGNVQLEKLLAGLVGRAREFDFNAGRFGRTFDPGSGNFGNGQIGQFAGEDNLKRIAAELGTSLVELERAAGDLGITLRDGEGRIFVQGLRDLGEALQLARRDALTLSRSFSALQSQQTVRDDLFNVEGPAAAFRNAIALAQDLLPGSIAQMLAGFDIQTSGGRDAARQFLQNLFEQASSGDLVSTLEGSGFANIQEFFDFLILAEEPLDALSQAAGDAATALSDLNVPPGFKKNLIEYIAQSPIGPQLQLESARAISAPRPISLGTPAPAPTTVQTTVNVTVQGSELTPRELFAEFEAIARSEIRRTGGASAAADFSLYSG